MTKKNTIDEDLVVSLYLKGNHSTYAIADKLGTYPNKIRRILQKRNIECRSKSEAQSNALATGRSSHPTEGTTRSEETKIKISETQGRVWDSLTEEERKRRSDIGKDSWNQRDETERQQTLQKSREAIRESSRHGSKLERFLLNELSERDFRVEFHKERWLRNQRLQVDLYLPDLMVAIEVDGPSHFKPVWGMENLLKNQKSDHQKTGLILSEGLALVRIKQTKKLSQRYMRNTLSKLLSLLSEIKERYPKEHERYFEI